MTLYAWIGEDEYGGGQVGLKQGLVPAGIIPLCCMDHDRKKLERLRPQMEQQATLYGKRIYLAAFEFTEIIDATDNGAPAKDFENGKPA